jgi:capsular polysaccharide biosynthesis protein
MLASELTLFCLVTILFLFVGGVIGWLTKSHIYETQIKQVYVHPEMFDENGNILPDEILAVRFENNYDDYDEEENDDED